MSPPRAQPQVSNSAADRAGDKLRRFMELPEDERTHRWWSDRGYREEMLDAASTITDYRALHATPMTSVTMGIRSMVQTVRRNDAIRPAQRFKRLDRIREKLMRFPRMRLSQMEDIGGCRVVLPTLAEVDLVLHRIHHNWPEAGVTNYIESPKEDGYRGIHIVKRRGGRLVEVQLRTTGQHEWAEAIEIASPRVRFNLKDGEGPADLREYFKQAAERIALRERGEPVDEAAEREFARLRSQVVPYFQD